MWRRMTTNHEIRNGNQQQGECHLFDLAPEAASWRSRPWSQDSCQPATWANRAGTGLHHALHPLPARNEWGEDRGEGNENAPPLPSPLLHPMGEREKSRSFMQPRAGRKPASTLSTIEPVVSRFLTTGQWI